MDGGTGDAWRRCRTCECGSQGASTGSVHDDAAWTAGDQARHVHHRARQFQVSRGCQIARPPLRQEFFLVRTQSLEIVEALAMAVEECADAVPQWRELA